MLGPWRYAAMDLTSSAFWTQLQTIVNSAWSLGFCSRSYASQKSLSTSPESLAQAFMRSYSWDPSRAAMLSWASDSVQTHSQQHGGSSVCHKLPQPMTRLTRGHGQMSAKFVAAHQGGRGAGWRPPPRWQCSQLCGSTAAQVSSPGRRSRLAAGGRTDTPWDPSPAQGTCKITKTVTLLLMRIVSQDICGTNGQC